MLLIVHYKSLKICVGFFSLSQLQGGESQMLPGEHLTTSYDENSRLVTNSQGLGPASWFTCQGLVHI